MDFIPYAKPWITNEDRKACCNALATSTITRGPLVEQFEQEIAAYCKAPFAVAFNSGTSALTAAYFAAHLTSHDRVVTSPNTFVGTVTGALSLGADVVFGDIEEESGNLNLKQLPNLTTPPKGKQVIVPIHFGGSPIELEPLSKGPWDLIIEDGCHAFGACYENGLPIGSDRRADMTIFSFHPSKTITMGEGGVVVTHHKEYVDRLYMFRNNGITYSKGLVHTSYATGNFNVTEMQAALGLSQLKRVDQIVKRRKELTTLYQKYFSDIPSIPHTNHSSHHLFCLLLKKDREGVMERLKKERIGTQIHYIPLYKQPLFNSPSLPACERYHKKTLTLPLYYELTEKEIEKIAKSLNGHLRAIGE